MTFLGQPLSSNIFLIRSISPLSLRLVQIIRARCTNADIRLILRLKGLKDSQRKYWPVKVGASINWFQSQYLFFRHKHQETIDIFLSLF